MRPILDLCEETVLIPGSWVSKIWWGQEGLDLVGVRVTVAAVEEEEGKE